MNGETPYLIVRATAVYIAAVAATIVWAWRRPHRRTVAGALLATAWNLPALLAVHVAAMRFEWWEFDARGGLLLGMPVDLLLAWACWWGLVPAIGLPSQPLVAVAGVALAADFVLMPAAAPVVRLGEWWIAGDSAALLTTLIPAQLQARWTARDEHLTLRAVLQVIAFSGLLLFLTPAVVIQATGLPWRNPLTLTAWQISLILHVFALPALLGLTAVQEFVQRGGGTPVPFDPPRRLVTSGVYAYVRNPMQLAGVLLLILLGLTLRNWWLAAAGVMAHLYSVGLAGWDEDEDLGTRFGDDWQQYRAAVRRWIPSWRPWAPPDRAPARLYVSERCGMCREVGEWLLQRRPRGLEIVAAASHPSGALMRITYEPGDGGPADSGVAAFGRALEHTHFAWALTGFALRLPIATSIVQLLVDASGGEARPASPCTCDVRQQRRTTTALHECLDTSRDEAYSYPRPRSSDVEVRMEVPPGL